MLEQLQWQVQPPCELPDWFVQAVHQAVPEGSGFAAQLLWQRGIQNPEQLTGFINPDLYQPVPLLDCNKPGSKLNELRFGEILMPMALPLRLCCGMA
jgi:hypothetical protein